MKKSFLRQIARSTIVFPMVMLVTAAGLLHGCGNSSGGSAYGEQSTPAGQQQPQDISPTPHPSMSPTTSPSPGQVHLESGTWGGEHIEMTITETSTHVRFRCGEGRIVGAILTSPGSEGAQTFDVVGLANGNVNEVDTRFEPARFGGTVTGDRMDLTIEYSYNNRRFITSFQLLHGTRWSGEPMICAL